MIETIIWYLFLLISGGALVYCGYRIYKDFKAEMEEIDRRGERSRLKHNRRMQELDKRMKDRFG